MAQTISEENNQEQEIEFPGINTKMNIDELSDLVEQEAMASIKEMAEMRKEGIHIRTKSQEIEITLKLQLYDRLIKISKIEDTLREHKERKRTVDVAQTEQIIIGHFPDESTFQEKLLALKEKVNGQKTSFSIDKESRKDIDTVPVTKQGIAPKKKQISQPRQIQPT